MRSAGNIFVLNKKEFWDCKCSLVYKSSYLFHVKTSFETKETFRKLKQINKNILNTEVIKNKQTLHCVANFLLPASVAKNFHLTNICFIIITFVVTVVEFQREASENKQIFESE